MSGRSLTEKGRRRQLEKVAKKCQHHKGAGNNDGNKPTKRRVWYTSAPYIEVKPGTFVSTTYSSNGST